jgi:poly(3-hydroxybutyrate) depolymerase
MSRLLYVAVLACCATRGAGAQLDGNAIAGGPPVLMQASSHPMQYYVSLPRAWRAGGRWQVMIALPGSSTTWLPTAAALRTMRDTYAPDFIVVVPLITMNGGSNPRRANKYTYADSVWDRVAREGNCAFDAEGVEAVIADVRKRFGGNARVNLTGFSAGGHLAWALTFLHPDWLRAVAISSGNYLGRCVSGYASIADPALAAQRKALPIHLFDGSLDSILQTNQGNNAVERAARLGFPRVARDTIANHGHEPYYQQVLLFFAGLANNR